MVAAGPRALCLTVNPFNNPLHLQRVQLLPGAIMMCNQVERVLDPVYEDHAASFLSVNAGLLSRAEILIRLYLICVVLHLTKK